MAGVNKVILLGRVGKEPETRSLPNNKVTSFSIATSEKYKDKEVTEWHNIEVWDKLSDIVEKYVKKGDNVYIEGKIKTESWEDKDGTKKFRTKIQANSIQLLGGGKQEAESTQSAPSQDAQTFSADTDSEDLPF